MSTRGLWDRFWEKVDASGDCWEWTAAATGAGYGAIWVDGRMELAHRKAFELLVGPIPAETLDHLCLNRLCVNPDHLEPVSRAENTSRGFRPGRNLTHCKRGHPFDAKNTHYRKRGGRECRTCHRDGEARRRAA